MKDFPMELLVDVEDGGQFPLRISVTLAQLVERLTFNQVVMGSSPICDTNFGRPSGERQSFPESG